MKTYTDFYSGNATEMTVLAEGMSAQDKVNRWLDFDIKTL